MNKPIDHNKQLPLRAQQILVGVTLVLFVFKIIAWRITGSVAILTDALESTVNVVAGFVGLYSLSLSAKPRDREHPYGHGKVEFIASAIEGILISIAGFIIIYEAVNNFYHPHTLKQLDYGLLIVFVCAAINFMVGVYCVNKGKALQSPVLQASGAHLKSDAYSSFGLMLGVLLILVTRLAWIDSVAALIFAAIIIATGFKIIRKSVSGIMDESDDAIIDEVVELLNNNRHPEWIDVHNMRVIDYAGFLHIDAHLTVPFYIDVQSAHTIQENFTSFFKTRFNNRVEFFIHTDPCIPIQCGICQMNDCPKRQHPFVQAIHWSHNSILSNQKHALPHA